jgi:hypothetical protein
MQRSNFGCVWDINNGLTPMWFCRSCFGRIASAWRLITGLVGHDHINMVGVLKRAAKLGSDEGLDHATKAHATAVATTLVSDDRAAIAVALQDAFRAGFEACRTEYDRERDEERDAPDFDV